MHRAFRVELAAAYRMVDYFGWTELIYGHLTARVPSPELYFLINPYGRNYDEVTASNLVKIDCDGNTIGDSDYPVNSAGFVIHSAIHMATTKNKCVMHTHSGAGMAIAALKDELRPVSMNAITFHGRVGYHDFTGPSLHLHKRKRLLADLGDNKAMILRNHGLMTVGGTVAQTLLAALLLGARKPGTDRRRRGLVERGVRRDLTQGVRRRPDLRRARELGARHARIHGAHAQDRRLLSPLASGAAPGCKLVSGLSRAWAANSPVMNS